MNIRGGAVQSKQQMSYRITLHWRVRWLMHLTKVVAGSSTKIAANRVPRLRLTCLLRNKSTEKSKPNGYWIDNTRSCSSGTAGESQKVGSWQNRPWLPSMMTKIRDRRRRSSVHPSRRERYYNTRSAST